MNKEILCAAGIDYDAGVKQFMNRSDIYEKLLKNFINENSFDEAKKCVEAKDWQGVLRTIHGMKSVTGTLYMTELYKDCCQIVVDIRADKLDVIEEEFNKIYVEYSTIIRAIAKA